MEFTLTHPDIGKASVLLVFDGVPYEADSDHPWWNEIIDLLLKDDDRVVDLFPIRPFQRPSAYFEDPTLEPLSQEDRQAAEAEHEARQWVPTRVSFPEAEGFTVGGDES